MAKSDLQRDIRKSGGFILSEGTLNLEHLLAKAYDLIVPRYQIRSGFKLADEIAKVLNYKGGSPYASQESYYGNLKIIDMETASYLWNEVVYNFFNELSPKGYYFGSHMGDGACIGWFKVE